MPRYNFILSSGQFCELQDHAKLTGQSMSDHVRRALELYFHGQPCFSSFVVGNVAASGTLLFLGRS